jgi:hypothetical protein
MMRLEWLNQKIQETNKPVGIGMNRVDAETGKRIMGTVHFDQRHKIYENLKKRLLMAYPDLAEINAVVNAFGSGKVEEWLLAQGVVDGSDASGE